LHDVSRSQNLRTLYAQAQGVVQLFEMWLQKQFFDEHAERVDVPHGCWHMGQIQQLLTGADTQTRPQIDQVGLQFWNRFGVEVLGEPRTEHQLNGVEKNWQRLISNRRQLTFNDTHKRGDVTHAGKLCNRS